MVVMDQRKDVEDTQSKKLDTTGKWTFRMGNFFSGTMCLFVESNLIVYFPFNSLSLSHLMLGYWFCASFSILILWIFFLFLPVAHLHQCVCVSICRSVYAYRYYTRDETIESWNKFFSQIYTRYFMVCVSHHTHARIARMGKPAKVHKNQQQKIQTWKFNQKKMHAHTEW